MKRKNKACRYFPCHNNLEDCTFCYCPLYPCLDETKGYYIDGKDGKIWDCSACEWIHSKETVDNIFDIIRKNI
jgi:Zn-finger protein